MRARCVVFNQITQGCGLGTLLEEDLIDSFVAAVEFEGNPNKLLRSEQFIFGTLQTDRRY